MVYGQMSWHASSESPLSVGLIDIDWFLYLPVTTQIEQPLWENLTIKIAWPYCFVHVVSLEYAVNAIRWMPLSLQYRELKCVMQIFSSSSKNPRNYDITEVMKEQLTMGFFISFSLPPSLFFFCLPEILKVLQNL